ncbi:hypothetical protein [Sinorhizobium meliloti]|uniref:hypothetical protein n=1 Tax=Rhizobium meliloti TaxID=382 RepID=UPI000FD6CB39|nr:hypothetical protein [Sinorhizobium meliloti]MQX59254.1 hypothetical protein [Sinorhizobium meliloti]RVG78714.1 hypothetical protein CN219_27940 [Sinorhizobium meliloti]RVI21063.1 hypothetical protein CN197_34455 [Sinorhizobium meliloti]RVI39467.1 hypothetical protein CN196_31070 [Sinorhizobium meliloti]RVJ19764.1 hypothetical protein CN177_25115 [Sinorhizobium meliloti]
MSMHPLLDHDDFAKSRKALIATAAFLLLINQLQIAGESIDVSGLTLKIDRDTVVGFGSLFLVYFTYVFIVRAFDQVMSSRIVEVREDLDRLIKDAKEVIENETFFIKRIEFENRLSGTISKLRDTTKFLSRFVLISVEVGPPLLLALYTAYAIGAPAALLSFLINT